MQHRGGKGVKCYKITAKTGDIVGAKFVDENDELMIITTEGIIIRMPVKDISILKRITSGVKLINLDEGTYAASIARITESMIEENEEENGDDSDEETEETPDDTTEE